MKGQFQTTQPRESISEEVTCKLRLQMTNCVTLGRLHNLSEPQFPSPSGLGRQGQVPHGAGGM